MFKNEIVEIKGRCTGLGNLSDSCVLGSLAYIVLVNINSYCKTIKIH